MHLIAHSFVIWFTDNELTKGGLFTFYNNHIQSHTNFHIQNHIQFIHIYNHIQILNWKLEFHVSKKEKKTTVFICDFPERRIQTVTPLEVYLSVSSRHSFYGIVWASLWVPTVLVFFAIFGKSSFLFKEDLRF